MVDFGFVFRCFIRRTETVNEIKYSLALSKRNVGTLKQAYISVIRVCIFIAQL